MDAVKKAIRNALQKGDANDRAFREKVYRQIFDALDRSLQARTDLSPESVRQRRDQVKAAIVEVERGFVESAPAVEVPPSQSSAAAPRRQAPGPEAPPQAAPRRVPDPDLEPRIDRDDRLTLDERRDFGSGARYAPRQHEPRKRRSFILPLVLLVLVAVIGVGLWRMMGGLPQSMERLGAGPPGAADGASGGQSRPSSGTSQSDREWITVFSPEDPTSVSTPAGASADAMSEGDTAFLRIGSGGAGTPIAFDVGQGVLERLTGRSAVFSVTARAAEGETQISISCDFGVLGDCGRTRYLVGEMPADYLFEVSFPDDAPNGGGTVSITPDIEGTGRLLDVYSLRVTLEN